MHKYVLRRLVAAIPTFFAVTLVVFILIRVIPGDIVSLMQENEATALVRPDQADLLREELGLNRPIAIQYLDWVYGFLRGDLGNSPWSNRPVFDDVSRRFPVTIQLAVMTMVVATAMGITFGIISAIRQNSITDYTLRILSIGGLSAPGFWVATMVIVVLANYMSYLPPPEYREPWTNLSVNMQQMIWPALVLGISLSAAILRMTRATMLEVLRQDYIRTAHAKGLPMKSVIVVHALRNAMIPVITVMGGQFGFLLGGTVIMETIFGLPGIGEMIVGSINRRDYPLLQVGVVILALSYLALNLAIDLIYALLNPQIRQRYT